MDELMSYRARIGGFHVTAAKLSNHKLHFLNARSIYPCLLLALYGAHGVKLAIFLFFCTNILPHLMNEKKPIYPASDQKSILLSCSNVSNFKTIACLYVIISLLLILASDIETNPGPIIRNLNDNISIIHNNIKSLANKVDLITPESEHHDIITISETWLTTKIHNNKIHLPNFFPPIRRDRDDGHGGVAIYVRNNMFCKERPDLSVNDLEAVWIETKLEQETLLVGCFYRPLALTHEYITGV